MSSFWLEFDHNGQTQNASFNSQSVTIGRDRGSDFILDHPTVSRQHALIVEEGGGNYRLVVLSRGGLTAVDGQPVNGEVSLWDGAMLTLGKHSVRFRAPDSAARGGHAPAAVPHAQMPQPSGFGATPAGGGFGQPAGGGVPGGFGQPASGGAGGFGQAPSAPGASGFGQSAGQGFGQPAPGGFAQQPVPGGFGAPPPSAAAPEKKEEKSGDAAGIISWDEIAASDEALSEGDDEAVASDYQRIQSASKKAGAKPDETSPVVVIVGVLIAVGMLGYTFFGGGPSVETGGAEQVAYSELPPVQLDVDCVAETDCMRKAQEAYRIATDLLDKRDVENRNLFDGYKRLLESRELMTKGGIEQFPPEMQGWQALHDDSRAQLDAYYKNFRAAFHSAKQRQRYMEMAQTLKQLEAFFPDKTSRENRWASEMEMDMKSSGTYPRTMR
ncbi:FHA domain-containing protein [Bradymonadaceae bacterium TMQ3]|nr:FHA domain-containing protein [Bradymonadaceae bacterium TMQ3]TXC77292.1 FHA domain-containing protein [Bradymonadales bacterium TMQ1]